LRIVVPAVEQAVHWLAVDEDLAEWDIAAAASAHSAIADAVRRRQSDRAREMMSRHLAAFRAAAAEKNVLHRPLLPPSHWSSRLRSR
jgi:DNA-binding FadR family transcriptional regulator